MRFRKKNLQILFMPSVNTFRTKWALFFLLVPYLISSEYKKNPKKNEEHHQISTVDTHVRKGCPERSATITYSKHDKHISAHFKRRNGGHLICCWKLFSSLCETRYRATTTVGKRKSLPCPFERFRFYPGFSDTEHSRMCLTSMSWKW